MKMGEENDEEEVIQRKFRKGDYIKVSKLVKAKAHNGKPGLVLGFDEEKGRYQIRFFDKGGTLSLLKEENLADATVKEHHDTKHNFASLKLTVPEGRSLVICERGMLTYYSAELTSMPHAPVIIDVDYDNTCAVCHPNRLYFTPENWNIKQKVSVKSMAIPGTDNAEEVIINHRGASNDDQYNSPNLVTTPTYLLVTILDSDAPYLWGFGTVPLDEQHTAGCVPHHIDLKSLEHKPKGDSTNHREAWVRPWRDNKNGTSYTRKKAKLQQKCRIKERVLSHVIQSSKLKGKTYMSAPSQEIESRRIISRAKGKKRFFDHNKIDHEIENEAREDARCQRMWKAIDTGGDGTVSVEELRLYFKRTFKYSDVYIDRMVNFVDKDKSGIISLNEFKSYMKNRKKIRAQYIKDKEEHQVQEHEEEEQNLEKQLFPVSRQVLSINIQTMEKRRTIKRKKKKHFRSFKSIIRQKKAAAEEAKANGKKDQKAPTHITEISCGEGFSCFVTGKGKLYTFGENNSSGQLAHGDYVSRYTPTVWDGMDSLGSKHRVANVSCGSEHAACTTSEGIVLTWGNGANGKLGHGNCRNVTTPSPVRSLLHDAGHRAIASSVACGGRHTVMLTENRDVYSWGFGQSGALALCDRKKRAKRRADVLTPARVHFFDSAHPKKVVAGGSHNIFIMGGNGLALSVGWGDDGQLGRSVQGSDDVPRPVQMPQGEAVCDAACGDAHSLVLCENNHVYAFGDNSFGQLGIGNRKKKFYPQRVPLLSNLNIILLQAGGRHSAAITQSGALYTWGAGEANQIGWGEGNGNRNSLDGLVPRNVERLAGIRVIQVALGQAHSLCTSMEPEADNQLKNSVVLRKNHDKIDDSRKLRIKKLFELVDQTIDSNINGQRVLSLATGEILKTRLEGELIGWNVLPEKEAEAEEIKRSILKKIAILSEQKLNPANQETRRRRIKCGNGRPATATGLVQREKQVPKKRSKRNSRRPSTAIGARTYAPPSVPVPAPIRKSFQPPSSGRVVYEPSKAHDSKIPVATRPATANLRQEFVGRRKTFKRPATASNGQGLRKVYANGKVSAANGKKSLRRPATALSSRNSPRKSKKRRPVSATGRALRKYQQNRTTQSIAHRAAAKRSNFVHVNRAMVDKENASWKALLVQKHYGVGINIEVRPSVTEHLRRMQIVDDYLGTKTPIV